MCMIIMVILAGEIVIIFLAVAVGEEAQTFDLH